jgi:hypothetical protein
MPFGVLIRPEFLADLEKKKFSPSGPMGQWDRLNLVWQHKIHLAYSSGLLAVGAMSVTANSIKLLAGNSHPELAEKISQR